MCVVVSCHINYAEQAGNNYMREGEGNVPQNSDQGHRQFTNIHNYLLGGRGVRGRRIYLGMF